MQTIPEHITLSMSFFTLELVRPHESEQGLPTFDSARVLTVCFGRPWRTFSDFAGGTRKVTRPRSSAPDIAAGHGTNMLCACNL